VFNSFHVYRCFGTTLLQIFFLETKGIKGLTKKLDKTLFLNSIFKKDNLNKMHLLFYSFINLILMIMNDDVLYLHNINTYKLSNNNKIKNQIINFKCVEF
jgi:hypothetical protein